MTNLRVAPGLKLRRALGQVLSNALTRLLFSAVFIAGLSGCAGTPLEAVSDFDDGYDFSAVEKLVILPVDRTMKAETLISDMQVDRINDALATELANRGFNVVTDRADADLYLAWHLVTREKTDIRSYNTGSAMYNCWRCGPPVADVTVRQYTEGTFVVDFIDPDRNRSVFRSTIQSRLRAQPDPVKAAENRAVAARAVFAPFPPGA